VDEERTTPPHVVMMVANHVTADNRVLRSATSLARAGARVTVLGLSPSDVREETMLGDVRIVRVPVAFLLREALVERRAKRRAAPWPLGYPSKDQMRAARKRLDALEVELAASSGAAATEAARRLAREQRRNRLRGAVTRRTERFWEKRDRRWAQRTRDAHWRDVVPEVGDYELAFGPVLDALEPDVVHAHDVHLVGLAAHAVDRARAQGRDCSWVYDAHEYVVGLSEYNVRTRRVVAAWADLEAEFVGGADRVVTVSPSLADALQRRFAWPTPPAVVLNIPPAATDASHRLTLRDQLGLAPVVPLLVYSGTVQKARGVQTAVEALVELSDAHLAVVAVPNARIPAMRELIAQAQALGVRDRFHAVDPVAPHQVSEFLSSADVGLIPLLHFGSHEVALANKLFEYLHAGIPSVVSDCEAQSAFVREHGVGVVHRAGDAADLARAVREALARRDELVAAASDPALRRRYTWEGQEQVLVGVYRDLTGFPLEIDPTVPFRVPQEQPVHREGPPVVGFGPANSAGQAWAWAKALERSTPGATTCVVAVVQEPYDYGRDVAVEADVFARDVTWQRRTAEMALGTWTHALLEAGRPVLGTLHGQDFTGDAAAFRGVGVRVGLVLHGSEIRDPRRHAAEQPWSPFRDPDDLLTVSLQRRRDTLAPLVRAFDGPVLVATPDLLDDVPDAVWLPLAVDTGTWSSERPVLVDDVPLVLHAPSHSALKGTEGVERALLPLAEAGAIRYERVEGVPPSRMGEVLAAADIVIDQLPIGSYGVLACEAMASGRVVVGRVDERTRARVLEATGLDVPVVDADPDNLADVVLGLLADRDAARERAAAGARFVAEVHDGRASARVLRQHLLGLDA
jgi:glycosyltransferase involved in cell wall biosynthesis